LASPAPHDWNVDRQNEEAERKHPEAEHRKEAERTAAAKLWQGASPFAIYRLAA